MRIKLHLNYSSMHFLVRSINRFFEYTSDSNLDLSKLKGFWVGYFRQSNIPNGNFKVRSKMDFLEIKPEKVKRIHQKDTVTWVSSGRNMTILGSKNHREFSFYTPLWPNFGSKGAIEPEFRHCSVKNVVLILAWTHSYQNVKCILLWIRIGIQ